VRVRHLVTLKVAGTGLRKTFTGRIGPKHVRRLVVIQRKSGTRWVTFLKVRTGTRSTFRISKTLTRGRRYQFRARTAADTQHLLGISTIRRVRT